MARVLVAACSFEERSVVWPQKFLEDGGDPENVFLADIVEPDDRYQKNLKRLRALGIHVVETVDRFSSGSLWKWAYSVVERAFARTSNLTVDISCLPRELLGMLLFLVSVWRKKFSNVRVVYVSAPDGGYASQNLLRPESDRWLSKGVSGVRSIVGFPGTFRGDWPCHLIVLAGHEIERILEIIEYVEPSRLTISAERVGSSTVESARDLSSKVAEELKGRIQVPHIGGIEFSSSSIEEVVKSLDAAQLGASMENVALVAMNTKVSFVGAAMFGLANRRVRMVYAVPRVYNPLYCEGVGKTYQFDITKLIQSANTECVDRE